MNPSVIQFNQNSRIIAGRNLLSQGSQVLVRVISEKGNGKYEGSVAGVRVNIFSEKKLSIGSTFLASINSKNGKIFVTPKNHTIIENQNVELNKLQNSQISSILKQLNLPLDGLSLHLFQQFKQMEMKEDSAVLLKIRNMAIKYSGKEKKAAEILTILNEKGIESVSSEEILQLLEELDGSFEDKNQHNSKKEKFKLMNKINSTQGKWFFVPFEIITLKNDDVLGNGNIKIMVDFAEKLKILCVDCNYKDKKYLFNLQFENSKCTNIYFNTEKADFEKSVKKLQNKLNGAGINAQVQWSEKMLVEGTGCGLEKIMGVGGIV